MKQINNFQILFLLLCFGSLTFSMQIIGCSPRNLTIEEANSYDVPWKENFGESWETILDIKILTPTPTSIPTPTQLPPGAIQTSSFDGMDMVFIPSGEFSMGEDVHFDEQPIHPVYLDAFWIDRTEITNNMIIQYFNAEGFIPDEIFPDEYARDQMYYSAHVYWNEEIWVVEQGYGGFPATQVTWYAAKAYCEWVDRRLPTEAEWEKAARGLDSRFYPWGDEEPTCDLANGVECHQETIHVGSKKDGESPYGIYNMAGNVWEWIADWYGNNYYQVSPYENPTGPSIGEYRVLRGGSWRSMDKYLKTTYRYRENPNEFNSDIGFRCAMDAEY